MKTTLTMSEIFPAYDFDTITTVQQMRGMISLVTRKLAQDGFTDAAQWLGSKPVLTRMPGKAERNAMLLAIAWKLKRCGYTLTP